MAEFETTKSKTRELGKSGFVALEERTVKEESGKGSRFVLLARGFYLRDGSPRRRNFVTMPNDPELLRWLAAELEAHAATLA